MYKTDARNITITNAYDALNRLIQRSASDNSFTYNFSYDIDSPTQSNGIGRLSISTNNVNGAAHYSYDPMGRISNRYVCVPGNCTYTLGTWASYDQVGDLITSALADGIQVNATYDGAGGLSEATTSANNTPVSVISNATYGPIGMTQAELGNGLIEHFAYDNRMRLNSYAVGTTSTTKYSYALSFFPNGNIQTASDVVNGTWNYSYDTLNRVLTGASSSTGLSWTYDAFGNRRTQTATKGSAPQTSFTFTTTTNRIDGYCYDAAGNILVRGPCPTGGIHQNAYDGEGKLVSSESGTVTYTYDGDGKRIAKSSGGAVTNVYFYDVNGNRVVDTNGALNVQRTEIFAGGRHLATYSPGFGTNYNHVNWLGTETARTDINGNICETLTGLPFGDGHAVSGACSSSPDYFTGKERDSESGNDYFGARYESSSMGRFMSPDIGSLHPDNPQSLNRYAYALNNPLRWIDPDGMNPIDSQLLNHVTHFQAWATPIAEARIKEMVQDRINQNYIISTDDSNNLDSLFEGGYGSLFGEQINMLQNDVDRQVLDWANLSSTTANEVWAAKGQIDGNQEDLNGSSISGKIAKGADKAGDVANHLAPLAPEIGETVGKVLNWTSKTFGQLGNDEQRYLSSLLGSQLNRVATEKEKMEAAEKAKKCEQSATIPGCDR